MPSYVLPQTQVFQEFLRAATATAQPLRACPFGQQFDLHRYSEAAEKPGILVADAYDSVGDTCFPWPGRQAGGIVDPGYSKVFIDNALLKFYDDPAGVGSTVKYITPGKNKIHAVSTVWATANGVNRSAELLRDVQVGDIVGLSTGLCGGHSMRTSVIGLLPELIAASVGSATFGAGNKAGQSASSSHAFVRGTANNVTIASVDGTTYDGLATGDITETYTIEVVTGGSTDEAVLKVTSQSGNDDEGLVTFTDNFSGATAIGTRGLKIDFTLASHVGGVTNDVFLVGQVWTVTVHQLYVTVAGTAGGTYAGTANTTYIATVTRGGHSDSLDTTKQPLITASTTTGIDVSGPTPYVGSAIPIGTLGVTFVTTQTKLAAGDTVLIVATAATNGAMKTLVLANNLVPEMRGDCTVEDGSSNHTPPDLSIQLFIKKNIQVPATGIDSSVNWTQNDTELCLSERLLAFDSSWKNNGALVALPVQEGAVYVEHRDAVADALTLGTINDVANIPTLFPSAPAIHPDNPLVFGVYKALLNANGQDVKFLNVVSLTGVAALTLDDWLATLEKIIDTDDVYGLVPLSQDKDVLDATLAHCVEESSPTAGRFRICWLNQPSTDVITVYNKDADGNPVLATIIDDPDMAGTQYTIVEVSGGQFVTKGVRAKDTLRALYTTDGYGNVTYSSFVVDAVINEDTIRLLRGPAAGVSVASKIEIHRILTKNEVATALAQLPGLFDNRRATLVWPDVCGNAGLTFPGYFLCAGLAGLRSGVLPHQGLTNAEIVGFDDLSRTTDFFSAAQLNTMAAAGYWIVTRDKNDGVVYTRQQLTCGDQTDINQREQSVTTNLDSISFAYLNRLKVYIGKGNVSPAMINIVHGEVLSLINVFKNTISVDRLGPQIIDATILELGQDPVFKDRIVIRVLNTLPAPFNNAEVHLQVQ